MTTAAVIPVRNRPELIVKAIRSIQAQTLPVDEIIVVDDGSTDETPFVVETMAASDKRLRLLKRKRSEGASAARNLGVNSSQSDWIAFLDSDDQWMPEKHQRQMAAIREIPGCIASFTGIRYQHPGRADDVPAPKTVSILDLRGRNVLGSTSTGIIRRSAFEAIGGFDETLPNCQDWDLWLRLRTEGEFVMITDPLIIYDSSDTNRISANLARVLDGHKNFSQLPFETLNHLVSVD